MSPSDLISCCCQGGIMAAPCHHFRRQRPWLGGDNAGCLMWVLVLEGQVMTKKVLASGFSTILSTSSVVTTICKFYCETSWVRHIAGYQPRWHTDGFALEYTRIRLFQSQLVCLHMHLRLSSRWMSQDVATISDLAGFFASIEHSSFLPAFCVLRRPRV